MTIVEALKDLYLAYGGQVGDVDGIETTAEVIGEIAKVIDGDIFKVRAVPVTDNTNLLGKTADQLQSGIKVKKDGITGTLAYVTGYIGFSGDVSEQSGHYIALIAESADGATIKAQVIGGTHGEVTLDSDKILVARIANNTQSIRFTATKNDKTVTIEYPLTNLVLAE